MKNRLGWVLALCFLALFLLGVNELPVNVRIGSITPQLDDTDKIAVSLYGSGSNSGDTAVGVGGSGGLNTIGHLDAAIHAGYGYEASGRVDVGNGASYDVLITVHATTECAMIFEWTPKQRHHTSSMRILLCLEARA